MNGDFRVEDNVFNLDRLLHFFQLGDVNFYLRWHIGGQALNAQAVDAVNNHASLEFHRWRFSHEHDGHIHGDFLRPLHLVEINVQQLPADDITLNLADENAFRLFAVNHKVDKPGSSGVSD